MRAQRCRVGDLDAGRLAVRRSVGEVKTKGTGERLVEGPTKMGRSRDVDPDAGTVAALRADRAARGLLALDFVRDSAGRRRSGTRCDRERSVPVSVGRTRRRPLAWVHVDDLAALIADVATGAVATADNPERGPVAGGTTAVIVASEPATADYLGTVTGRAGHRARVD